MSCRETNNMRQATLCLRMLPTTIKRRALRSPQLEAASAKLGLGHKCGAGWNAPQRLHTVGSRLGDVFGQCATGRRLGGLNVDDHPDRSAIHGVLDRIAQIVHSDRATLCEINDLHTSDYAPDAAGAPRGAPESDLAYLHIRDADACHAEARRLLKIDPSNFPHAAIIIPSHVLVDNDFMTGPDGLC